MDRLEALTEKLVGDLSQISRKQAGYVIYDLVQGECLSFTLKEDKYVHLIDMYLAANTIFPLHNHEASDEVLILQRGEVTVICDDVGCEKIRHELKVGIPMYIPDGMNHFLHAKKGSWILATLIPPDEGMLK